MILKQERGRPQGVCSWKDGTQAQAFAFNFAPADAGMHCQKVMEVRHCPRPFRQPSSDYLIVYVVWCGVVWCGVVWCGVVWCGVVWCGVVCSSNRLSCRHTGTCKGQESPYT